MAREEMQVESIDESASKTQFPKIGNGAYDTTACSGYLVSSFIP